MRARVVVPVSLLAAGCTTGVDLQRLSARAIQPTPYPDSVRVAEIRRSIQMTRWVATTPNGVYDCSQEADEKTPICARRPAP
jgi:hypothetical protein